MSFRAVMILRTYIGVRSSLPVYLVSVVASQDLRSLLSGTFMLAEISFVTQTTSGSSLNTDSATVSSTEARILTSEFSTLQTVETTRAGLIGC